jgi:hypothetical protein
MSATSLFRFLIKRWEFAEQFSAKMVKHYQGKHSFIRKSQKCNSYYKITLI